MHFLNRHLDNARHGGRGELRIEGSGDEIARWTILEAGPRGLESLRLISLACAGSRVVPHLDFDLRALRREHDRPLQLELVLALHPPYEVSKFKQAPTTTGIRHREKRSHYLASLVNRDPSGLETENRDAILEMSACEQE